MTTLTWNDVAKIAKKLQKEYKLPIFAMTYKNTCSCCASPAELNASSYLTKDVKDLTWKEIDSYIIFKTLTTVTVKQECQLNLASLKTNIDHQDQFTMNNT